MTGAGHHIPLPPAGGVAFRAPERIETERLLLRGFEPADFPGYRAYYTGDRTGGVGGPLPEYKVFERFCAMIGHWAVRGFGRYAIADRAGGPAFGHVGPMQLLDEAEAEMTWTIWDAARTGQGFATEAARAVLDRLFAAGWVRLPAYIDRGECRVPADGRPAGRGRGYRHPCPRFSAECAPVPPDPGRRRMIAPVSVISIEIPVYEEGRLRYRAPRMEDFEAYAAFRASDRAKGVGGPYTRSDAFMTLSELAGHWNLRGYGRWMIADRETDEPLGVVGIMYPDDWPEPEIGWSVFEAAEGKGIAYEASCFSRRYAYEVLGWTRIISCTLPGNTRSEALAKRMGAVWEREFPHEDMGVLNVWRHLGPGELA